MSLEGAFLIVLAGGCAMAYLWSTSKPRTSWKDKITIVAMLGLALVLVIIVIGALRETGII